MEIVSVVWELYGDEVRWKGKVRYCTLYMQKAEWESCGCTLCVQLLGLLLSRVRKFTAINQTGVFS